MFYFVCVNRETFFVSWSYSQVAVQSISDGLDIVVEISDFGQVPAIGKSVLMVA